MLPLVLLVILAAACHRPREAEPPIIDAHVHAAFDGRPERTSGIVYSLEELQRQMRAAGAVGAVMHESRDVAARQRTPDLRGLRILTCAGVDDKFGPDRLGEIATGLASGRYGCIKIYLGYVHRFAADPAHEPLYQLAERHDVPVVFHSGDTYSRSAKLKYADPLTIDEVAVDHPKVRFVIAHCGNPWIESAAEVAYKNSNVYLDGSALLIGDLGKRRPEDVDPYVARPLAWILGYLEDPTKLLFGSDWPLVDMGAYAAAFRRAVPRAHWRAVFHDNAARVFKLQGVGPGL